MVNVVMGKENRITTIESKVEGLGTKIRRCIHQDNPFLASSIGELQADARPSTPVTLIIRSTDLALTANNGDTCRGTCPEKGKTEIGQFWAC
tara:strand:+ start:223 stop:498 length:276 start_codon:yes stop_codon:yes gene_type:complete